MPSRTTNATSPFDRRRRLLEAAGWNPHALVAERLGRARRVLDVACGSGDFLGHALSGGQRVGVDHDPAAIALARARFPDVEWHVGDAGALPLDDRRFETVTVLQALLHVADPTRVLRSCRSVMAPGAALWATCNHSTHLTEFWQVLNEITRPTRPAPPDGDTAAAPLETQLERTMRAVFDRVHVEKITSTIRLSRPEALRLLDSYRHAFPCSEASWLATRDGLDARLERTVGNGSWALTVSLAVAIARDHA